MKKQGFSVIEFLIYLMASSSICLVLCSWMTRIVLQGNGVAQKNNGSLLMLTAFDCCARDIMSAPSHIKEWLKVESQYIVWKKQPDQIVGYQWYKKDLVRIAGHYDVVTQSTYKVTRSRVVKAVTNCQFTISRKGNTVIGVQVNFSLQKGDTHRECAQYISLKNV